MAKPTLFSVSSAGKASGPEPVGFDQFAEDEGLDFRHYWRVFLQYKWGIFGLVLGVSLFMVVWAFSLEPTYRATATVLIGGGAESISVSESDDAQASSDRSQFFNTQVELLKSREVARTVLERLSEGTKVAILRRQEKASEPAVDWRAWLPPSILSKLGLQVPTDGFEPALESDVESEQPVSLVTTQPEIENAAILESATATGADRIHTPEVEVKNVDGQSKGQDLIGGVVPSDNKSLGDATVPAESREEAASEEPMMSEGSSDSGLRTVVDGPDRSATPPAVESPDLTAESETAPLPIDSSVAPDPSDETQSSSEDRSDEQISTQSEKVLIKWLRDNLSVQPTRNTSMVEVSFDSWNARLSALIANAFTAAYLEYNLRQRRESTTQASAWLKDQLDKANQHVLTSVDELQQHREEAGLVEIEGLHSVQTEQLREAASALSIAQRARSEAESLYERAQRLQGEGRMNAIPVVRENGWVQELRARAEELERRIKSDEAKYTNAFPELEDAKAELVTVRSQLRKALDTIVEGFRTDVEIAKTNEKQLLDEVKALEEAVRDLDRKRLEATALEQSVATNRQYYDAFLNKLMETNTRQEDTVSMIAQVVDPAVPNPTPIKPNKKRMVMMGMLVSLFAGVGIALMLDKLNSTLRRREDIEERLGIPVLGELMLLGKKRSDGESMRPAVEFIDEPASVFAEEIRTIRTGVALSGIDQSEQTLVVTSTVSGEGKSTAALNLAFALGQLGTVLLIDADLRRPSIAKTLAMDKSSAGLTDLVAGTSKVAECIRAYEPGGIHVMTAGSSLPPDPLKILASERFEKLLANAATTYHAVVIDSAPVELVSDAQVLARKASGVLYVIRADHTSHQSVRRGLGRLSETGAPLLGAILNQINPKSARGYDGYKYGYGRYGAYGYGRAPEDVDAKSNTARKAG